MSQSDVLKQWQRCKPATISHPVVTRLGIQPTGWRVVPVLHDEEGQTLDFRIDEKIVTHCLVGLMTDHDNREKGLCYIFDDPQAKPVFYPHYSAFGGLTLGQHNDQEPICVVLSLSDGIAIQNAGGAVRVAFSEANLTALVTDLSKSGQCCYLPLAANGESDDYIKSVVKLAELEQVKIMPLIVTVAMSEADELAEAIQKLPTPQKPKSEYKPLFVSVGEMMKQTHSISWLIRGYMEAQSLSLMFGDPASGKSFNAVDMACCIATGKDWHGHKVLAGRVLYIAGEGNRGYSARCAAWSILNGTCLDHAPLSFSSKTVNLSDPKAAAQLNAEITMMTNETGEPPRLIIVDTVARTMDGDENSTRDMAVFVQQLDLLKDMHHCAILLVHHTGHGAKDRARGSTVLKGALDAEYRVSKDQDGMIRLECTKMKESDAPAPMAFKLTDVRLPMLDDEGEPIYKAAIERVEYSEPTRPSSSGLGKNQKLGLSVLHELIDEKRDTLQSKGYDPDDARVTVDEWKVKLEAVDINRQRFYEVKKGLAELGHIVLEAGNYVRVCSPTVF